MKGNFRFTNQYDDSEVILILDKLFLIEIEKKKINDNSGKSKIHLTGNGGIGIFEILDDELNDLDKVIGPDVRVKK